MYAHDGEELAGFHASYGMKAYGMDQRWGRSWDHPTAVKKARKVAVAYYEAKMALGNIKVRPNFVAASPGVVFN